MGVGVPQQSRAIGQTALTGQVTRGLFKHPALFAHPVRTVGIAEMRHVRHLIDLRQGLQA